MIALFWMSPSTSQGLTKVSGIFGKRICRVTKADILRDAKHIEDEDRAEALAEEASLKDEMQSCRTTTSGRKASPASSTSSLPSSIRTSTSNQPYPVRNTSRNNHHQVHHTSERIPLRPNFVPGITSSPVAVNSNQMTRPTSIFYQQPTCHQNANRPTFKPPNDRPIRPQFVHKHCMNRSFNDKENGKTQMFIPRDSTINKHAVDSGGYNLLEGLDVDSLFGDF